MHTIKDTSIIKDRKRPAWTIYSILKNNIVTFPIYVIMQIIEYCVMLFIYLYQS